MIVTLFLALLCSVDSCVDEWKVQVDEECGRLTWTEDASHENASVWLEVTSAEGKLSYVVDFAEHEFNFTEGLCSNTKYDVSVVLACGERVKERIFKTCYTPPAAPQNVTVVNVTSSSCLVLWDAPAGNLTAYRVDINGTIRETWGWSGAAVVDGLLPGAVYGIRVCARGEVLWSDYSEEVCVHTPKEVPPDPPPTLKQGSVTNTSIHVTWNGNDGDLFILKWYPMRGGSTSYANTSSTDYTLEDLIPATTYCVEVRVEGTGNWSDALCAQTEDGIPFAPRNVREGKRSSRRLNVQWDEPMPFRGPVLFYTVSCTKRSTRFGRTNSTSFWVERLQPGRTYQVRVSADTSAGRGNWSDPVEMKTLSEPPYPPRNLVAVNVTNDTIQIEWEPAKVYTGRILRHTVLWSGHPPANTTLLTHAITDLRPYTNYTIAVKSWTEAGAGNWSDPIQVRTAVGIPTAPRYLHETNVTNSSIEVEWEAPKPDVGPVLLYKIRWSDEGKGNSSQTRYAIRDLKAYTIYSVSVQAETAAGAGDWTDTRLIRTGIGIPTAPKYLHETNVTNSSIEVEWEAPEPDVGPVLGYKIRWSDEGNGNSSQTRYAIQSLKAYTNYSVSVQAETAAGAGDWTDTRLIRTGIGIPPAPRFLAQVNVSNTSITLGWSEPEPDVGPIIHYDVQWTGGAASTTRPLVRIENLNPYTNYSIRVRAETDAGKGNWTHPPLHLKTAVGVPCPPEDVKSTRVGSSSVHLEWKEPRPFVGPILEYVLLWKNVRTQTVARGNTSALHYLLEDLECYTNYSVEIFSKTAAGAGESSLPVYVLTKSGIPSPAEILNVELKNSLGLKVSWRTTASYPGPTECRLYVRRWPGECGEDGHVDIFHRGSQSREDWVLTHQNSVDQLLPYTRYSVYIVLETEAGEKASNETAPLLTLPRAPGPPSNVESNCQEQSTVAKITWNAPEDRNGRITEYLVEFGTEQLGYRERSLRVDDVCKVQEMELEGLRPEREYNIFVRARTADVPADGERATAKCILPAGVPPLGKARHVRVSDRGPFQLSLEWSKDTFSDVMGSLVHFAVIVGHPHGIGAATKGEVATCVPPWTNFSSEASDIYQATPPEWNPFDNETEDPLRCEMVGSTLHCVLGLDEECVPFEYCNGLLQPDTEYGVKVRAFTRGGFSESEPIFARTVSLPKSGLVEGLVSFSLVCVFLVIGAYIAKRKGAFQNVRKRIMSRFRHPFVTSEPRTVVQLEPPEQERYIKIENFCSHVRDLMADSHLRFSEEFEVLRQSSPKLACTSAEMEENKQKNRWMNIFPYDHSRVKLLPLGDEPASDFINANYMPGHSSLREYIASQGPLPQTVDDFWRMVWEQSSTMIVMLTQCVERGKVKCEQYWPPAGEAWHLGDIQVRTLSESMLSSYTIRVFHVQMGSQERRVKQMHFTHWPDFGCPESPEELVNFVKAVRDHLARIRPGPIVVHCSAGVGRTGTFISVDRLAQQLQHSDRISIFATVMELRQHRINMVQTEDQYIYIHLCVKQMLSELETQPPNRGECEGRLLFYPVSEQR